jgi:hypothetical protein
MERVEKSFLSFLSRVEEKIPPPTLLWSHFAMDKQTGPNMAASQLQKV